MARKLGRLGERHFAALVADFDGGATCNDAHEDEHGWDHVVEFDQQLVVGLPADLATALPPVFVQTKSREKRGDRKVSMKLSNALALTRRNDPCFVVLVTSVPGEPVGYHAVHWWDGLMARVLKRVRELSRDGVSEAEFHKRSFSFTMADGDVRAPDALIGWIKQTVRQQGRDYPAVKSALRDTLGFDGGMIGGSVSVGPLASVEELVDHQLGLTPSIAVEKITLHHRRFDVDIPFPLPDGPPTFVRMHANPAAKCDVRVRGPDGASFTLEGDFLAPAIPGLTEAQKKYRVRTPVFDLIWQIDGKATFHCSIDTAALRSPAELEKIARFIGWGGTGEIEIMVTVGDERLFGGTGSCDPLSDAPGWRRLAEPFGALARLAASRRSGPPLISVEQALAAEWLDLLHSVVASTETILNAEMTRDVTVPDFDHGISFAILTIGDWVFATLIRLPLIAQARTDISWRVVFGQAVLLETYVFPSHELDQFERLKADYTRHATRPGAFAIDNMLLHLAGEANG